jgi:hypothetical protein
VHRLSVATWYSIGKPVYLLQRLLGRLNSDPLPGEAYVAKSRQVHLQLIVQFSCKDVPVRILPCVWYVACPCLKRVKQSTGSDWVISLGASYRCVPDSFNCIAHDLQTYGRPDRSSLLRKEKTCRPQCPQLSTITEKRGLSCFCVEVGYLQKNIGWKYSNVSFYIFHH